MIQSLGHEVHVFDFSDMPEFGLVSNKVNGIWQDFERYKTQISGIHLIPSGVPGKSRYILGAWKLRQLAHELEVDMIMDLYGGGFALMTWLSGIRPYYVYVVGSDVLKVNRVNRLINRIILTKATMVFANGDHLASQARLQAPRADIRSLLIGINPDLFSPAAGTGRPVQIVCTRFFEDVYNNETLIRAIGCFPADGPDFRMVFTSGGSNLQACRAMVDQIVPEPLRNKIIFMGGVSYEHLIKTLGASHIFVSMSRSDGTATSLLEALASCLYPVLSDIPQNREWVTPFSKAGSLVGVDDAAGLATVLQDAIIHCDERLAAARENRSQVLLRADARANKRLLVQAITSHSDSGSRGGSAPR